MRELRTERLLLRPATAEDAPFLVELMNEAGYLSNIGDRGVRTIADAEAYLKSAQIFAYGPDGRGLNIVETLSDHASVGICGLVKRDKLDHTDLGYAILERFSGSGYASEAARATLVHAHQDLRFAKVLAITRVNNIGSRRILEKIGMTLENVLRFAGDDHETCLYAASST